MNKLKCPKCKTEWVAESEQGVSIEWHNQCVVCKFTPQGKGTNDGAKEELDLIAKESRARRNQLTK